MVIGKEGLPQLTSPRSIITTPCQIRKQCANMEGVSRIALHRKFRVSHLSTCYNTRRRLPPTSLTLGHWLNARRDKTLMNGCLRPNSKGGC